MVATVFKQLMKNDTNSRQEVCILKLQSYPKYIIELQSSFWSSRYVFWSSKVHCGASDMDFGAPKVFVDLHNLIVDLQNQCADPKKLSLTMLLAWLCL